MAYRFLGAMSIVMLFVLVYLLKVWLFSSELPTQNDTETKEEQNTINPIIEIPEIKGLEAKQTVLLLKPANVEEFERSEQPEPNQRPPSPSSPLSVHGIDFDEFVANWMRDNLVSPFDLEYEDQNDDIQSVPASESNSEASVEARIVYD